MTEIHDDITQAAREALREALRDPGCGVAIQMSMHSTSKAAFECAIARAIIAAVEAEREACAKIADDRADLYISQAIEKDGTLPGESALMRSGACAAIATAIRRQS